MLTINIQLSPKIDENPFTLPATTTLVQATIFPQLDT